MAHRPHQEALLSALAETYAMTVLVNSAKEAYVNDPDGSEATTKQTLAVIKAVASWSAGEVIAVCRERCGAQGMFAHNRIASYVPLVQGTVTAEGDNLVVLLDAAHEMVIGRGYEPPGARLRDPATEPLTELSTLARLFAYRESRLHAQARQEARQHRKAGLFERRNALSARCLELGKAHGERLAVEELLRAAGSAPTAGSRALLSDIGRRFALQRLRAVASWHLCEGTLSSGEVEDLPRDLTTVDARLLPHAEELVAAFGIDNTVLRAPLAADDVAEATWRACCDR